MITTIKLTDSIKYLVGLIVLILIAIYSTRFFSSNTNNKKNSWINIDMLKLMKFNILISNANISDNENSEINNTKPSKYSSRSGITRIFDIELPTLEIINEESNEENIEDETKEENERTTTEIKDTYTNKYGSVAVKNLTNIKLTENILKPDYNINNKKDIIIFHTHTCESYTATSQNEYKSSGNFRTTDLNYSVVKVGRVLEEELKKQKFNVIHNETKHDYPAYSGSYTRSLETVQELLRNNEEIEIIFDIHRDAVGNKSNYAPTVEINGEKVAQLMFVIGTNDGGGKHPNWENNLKFAVKVQEKANEMFPGLFRSINLRTATFNQKVTNAASIIEVGATGNTLEEAEASMKYLANVLDVVLND